MTDTFIIYRVESAAKTFAYLDSSREITFSFGQFPVISAGELGDSTEIRYSFVDADLTADGWIYFTHGFGTTVDYSVFMPTAGAPQEIVPDQDSYELNRLGINLQSYRPLTGLWSILIEI